MNITLITTGDPAVNPRTRPLIQILRRAGHTLSLVSPPTKTPLEGINHVFAKDQRKGIFKKASADGEETVANAAAKTQPELLYPLRERDIPTAVKVGSGWIMCDPNLERPSERDFVWSDADKGLAGDWELQSDKKPRGHVHLVARFTPTTPAQYLLSGFEEHGVEVTFHDGVLDWDRVDASASAVIIVESAYPAMPVVGKNKESIPTLFWAHHGEHHQYANLRLLDHYSIDAVLLAHSWHLAHQFPVPVFAMPFAVPTHLTQPQPFAERSTDVAMVAAGLSADGGWYQRRQDRARALEAVPGLTTQFTYGKTPTEMMELYGSSKSVINDGGAHHFPITMRVFEAIGSGSLLLTEPAPGLSSLFTPGKHFVEIAGTTPDQVQEALGSPTAATIAASAHEHAMSHHTYFHRTARILEIAESVNPQPTPHTQDKSWMAQAIDADIEVQTVLAVPSTDLAIELPTRDIRTFDSEAEYQPRRFDAVVLDPSSQDVSPAAFARSYVYLECTNEELVEQVALSLEGWARTTTSGGVTRFDSGFGGYRIRESAHPLG